MSVHNIYELSNPMFEVIKLFGVQAQFDLLQEECAELIQAISKCRRYANTKRNDKIRNLYEEIADVKILIDSLVNYTNAQILVDEFIDFKIKRLAENLENGVIK